MGHEKPGRLVDYSVYLLDSRGRIQAMQRLTAPSDECALWMLANVQFSYCAELWRRGRRLASVGSCVDRAPTALDSSAPRHDTR